MKVAGIKRGRQRTGQGIRLAEGQISGEGRDIFILDWRSPELTCYVLLEEMLRSGGQAAGETEECSPIL
jgi:hypothetical protein